MGVCILIVMNKSGLLLLLLLLLHLMLRVFHVLVDGFWCLGVMLEHETRSLRCTALYDSTNYTSRFFFPRLEPTYVYLHVPNSSNPRTPRCDQISRHRHRCRNVKRCDRRNVEPSIQNHKMDTGKRFLRMKRRLLRNASRSRRQGISFGSGRL